MSPITSHLFPSPSRRLSTVQEKGTSPIIRKWGKQFNNKCWNARQSSSSCGTMTMAVLASYLLIFTVVTSFVTSQPVTNIRLPNKLNIRATVEQGGEPLTGNSTDAGNGATIPTTIFTFTPHLDNKPESDPLGIPTEMEAHQNENKQEGEELNQLASVGNEKEEHGVGYSKDVESVSTANNHDNDDVLPMTMRNINTRSTLTTVSIPAFPSSRKKIRNEMEEGGKGGKEMGRDKDKVMVTDDVRGSSSRIVNPSSPSSASTTGNDNSEESPHPPSPSSRRESNSVENDIKDDVDDDEKSANSDSSKINITRTKSPSPSEMNLAGIGNRNNIALQSSQIMSDTNQPVTAQQKHGHTGDANVVNNHANFGSGDGGFYADNTEVDRSSKSFPSREDKDDSPTSKRATSVTKMNTSPLPSKRKAKGDDGGEDGDDDDDGSDINNQEYFYDSPPAPVVNSLEEKDNYGKTSSPSSFPSSSSSVSLMNKWIKTLVKLSQCRANCFQVEKEMSTTALGDFGDRKRKDEENTNFGGAQSNSLKPSLVFTPTAWSFGVDGGGRIIPSEQLGSEMQGISKAREKVRRNKTRKTPLLPTTPPGGAIKVTWGKSMKYHHELSNCQKSCQAKFPISKTFRWVREGGGGEAVIPAGGSKAKLDGEERNGNPNGTISLDDYNTGNENNGGNNNSHENIKTKPVPSAAIMEKRNEKGKSDWESGGNEDHYYFSPYEKGEKKRQRKNQLPSALLPESEESKFVKSAVMMMMTAVPGATGKETKRNKGIIPIGPSKSLMESLEIEEVKKYSTQPSISTTGSLPNLKTVPSEPQLTLRQLSLSSPVFLLSWPKPPNNPVSGNNNNRPEEASVSTQVEDKKGIVLEKDDDVDKDEKNGKKNQQWKKMGSSSEFSYAQPVTFVYSIILEESWEKIRSDGTADIYARRWKLIDQTMARTTTQIALPIQVHGTENKSGNEKGRKLNLRASGALIQEEKERMKRAEKQNSTPRMMIKQREDDHDDEETKRSSLVFSSIPSKVTVSVLAVNGQQGLVKVYSAKLNNSYYHLKGLDDQAISRQPDPLNPNQLSSSYLNPSEHNLNQPGDSPTLNFHPLNETTGSQPKEKPKKKGSISEKKVGEKSILANLDNENSNQILILPSKESLSGSRTRLGEKLMMTRIKQKNTNSVNDDDQEYRNQENSIKGWRSSTTSFIKMEENPNLLPLSSGEKTQNWGLRMVSQVYQKFLVVTQVTWNYPGSDYLQDDMIFSTRKTPSRDSEELLTRTMFRSPSAPESSSSPSTTPSTESSNSYSGNGSPHFESSTLSPENNAEEEENESRKKMAHSSLLSNEKWAGCGTDGRENIVEGDGGSGGGSKLTFLLSWEIFGGGLRGNLVTDTCSASISLWPDTAYIIQVGLITPLAKDRSNYSSSDNETSTSSSPLSSTVTETTLSAAEYDGHEHDIDDIDEISSDWKWREENRKRTVGSSSSGRKMSLVTAPEEDNADGNDKRQQEFLPQSPSSSDPLLLPESITFPFDGEPKVTIKSERILVNTTRANFIPDGHGSSSTIRRLSNDHDRDDARDGNDDTASSPIHNQDKMTRGNPKSNNNSEKEKVVRLGLAGLYYFKRGNVGEERSNFDENEDSPPERDFTSRDSKNGDVVVVRGGSGISDKMDVSEIIIGRNEKEDDDGYQHDHVFRANNQPATSAENDSESQAWEEDEDEATDQDESLFARSLAHHHHQQHHHGQRESDGPSFPELNKSPSPIKFDDRDEMNSKKGVDSDSQLSSGGSGNSHNNFLTMNRFYQSLYGISPNNLDLSNRYPNVIKIGSNGGGGGEGSSRHDNVNNINNSSARKQKAHSNLIDAKTIPLLLGEYTQYSSNGTKFIFPTEGNETSDEASGVRGKLYTLFVILVISFVVFLFIVAVVGFCVLTSSIKENYKYFVPKKVRVWTTVGQLLKGGSSADGEDNESGGGSLRGFRDSAEGSFYPRRLREEADDDEMEEDEEFDPDEEVTTSVPPSDDEDNSPGEDNECCCACDCVIERNYLEEKDKNSFSLSERRTSVTSETANLIRDGEEASVELMAPCDSSSNGEVGVSCHYHHHHHPPCGSDGNCDNNNPCYHTMPGVSANAEVQLHHHPHSFLSSPEEERTSTFSSTNLCLAATSNRSYSDGHPPQRQHCTHPRHHKHKRNSSDVRIDVVGSNRSKGQPNPRLQGYY